MIDSKTKYLLAAIMSQLGVIIILVYSIAYFIMGEYEKWAILVYIFIVIAICLAGLVVMYVLILSNENLKIAIRSEAEAAASLKFQQELERIIKRE